MGIHEQGVDAPLLPSDAGKVSLSFSEFHAGL